MTQTVKARMHYGAKSLDLTIPTSLCKKHGIEVGDVFEVSVEFKDEDLAIVYKRVYTARPKDR